MACLHNDDEGPSGSVTLDLLKRTVFWNVTPCSPVKIQRRLGGTYCFHVQYRIMSHASKDMGSKRFLSSACCVHIAGGCMTHS
jgi:hypothetical protein